MEFRPCIDIHNGKVKQIVGGSLKDAGDQAAENFVAGSRMPLILQSCIRKKESKEGILFF